MPICLYIIGGVLTPNYADNLGLCCWDARYQPGDMIQTCQAWNIDDILLTPSSLSSSFSPQAAAIDAPPKVSLPFVPLPAMSQAIEGCAFIQLTGSRAHEWLCIGGYDRPRGYTGAHVFAYNMLTNEWSHDTPMQWTRGGTAVAVMTATATTATTTTSRTTTASTASAAAAAAAAAALTDGVAMVYAFSGLQTLRDGDNTDTCEVYNPSTRTWTMLTAKMHNYGRQFAAAMYIPHWRAFVICGGYGGDEYSTDSIELYSPATNTFTLLTSSQWTLPEPQSRHTLQLMDYNILIVLRAGIWRNQPVAPAGWVIDLSPYATMNDVINTRTPLTWRELPLLHHPSPLKDGEKDDYRGVRLISSFII
jgi:hypothetical protein